MSVSSIAASGIRAATRAFEVNSQATANVTTPGFAPSRVVFAEARGGGVEASVETPIDGALMSGTDLITETLSAISAHRMFTANLTVLKAEHEMTATLLDVRR